MRCKLSDNTPFQSGIGITSEKNIKTTNFAFCINLHLKALKFTTYLTCSWQIHSLKMNIL